ncbi:MAG: hypothetical protein M1358_15970, partial [Chloroflexi bacterium]|nr:hypothetical protein [Chloroflexota bacterium]
GIEIAKKDKQLYDKAKAWWEREGKALLEQVAPQPEPTMVQPPSRSPVAKRSFANWSELQTQAAELADRLTGGSA